MVSCGLAAGARMAQRAMHQAVGAVVLSTIKGNRAKVAVYVQAPRITG